MQIGAMNHPARSPLDEIEWIGTNGFDFVDLTLEPPAADPSQVDGAVERAVRRSLALKRVIFFLFVSFV